MSLVIAGFYSGYLSLSLAAPVSNRTSFSDVIAPSWVAEPSGRGTWGILYSCVFTLVLCVYTAIHLNVPAKNNSTSTIWLRKIKWVLIAIFGPEIVVLTALDEWFSARTFLNELGLLGNLTDEKVRPKFAKYCQDCGKCVLTFGRSHAHSILTMHP
jgi:hypothetical protein